MAGFCRIQGTRTPWPRDDPANDSDKLAMSHSAGSSPGDGEDEVSTPMPVDDVSDDDREGSSSRSPMPTKEESTPAPRSPKKGKAGAQTNGNAKPGPQLVGHLPRADDDARRTFEELPGNHYQYSTLGRSREALESMTCDCQFVPGLFSLIISIVYNS